MHVILGILGSIVTILYMLDRLGIDLGGLNPFYWRRRRAWAKRYQGDPIYSVEDPMDVAALLIVGAAKLNGDVSSEQKQLAIRKFASTFSMNPGDAADLYASAVHLIGAPQVIDKQLSGVIDKNKGLYTNEQAESILELMSEVVAADGDATQAQLDLVESVRSKYISDKQANKSWS